MRSCLPDDDREVRPQLRQLAAQEAVVTEIEGLLLPEECDKLRAMAPPMQRSTVVDDAMRRVVDERRSSRTAFLSKDDEFTACLHRRFATVVREPVSHMEPMQLTDYKHKERYDAHYDFFDRPGERERTTTLFAYVESTMLEDGQCGGATTFHGLMQEDGTPLRVFPKKGNAVVWSNRRSDGSLNRATLHSGSPLTCAGAHKVGLNVWFGDRAWV